MANKEFGNRIVISDQEEDGCIDAEFCYDKFHLSRAKE
jgi:hypothetical protein